MKKWKIVCILIAYLLMVFNFKVYAIKFAIIGDYGTGDPETAGKVSKIVKEWNPDFILTTGDNNYGKSIKASMDKSPFPEGEEACHGQWSTIDDNIGQFYSEFIEPYVGQYVHLPLKENKFFPCLGNHDFLDKEANEGDAYFKYFPFLKSFSHTPNTAVGRYYDFQKGPIHFFILNSNQNEPHGYNLESQQFKWFKKATETCKENCKCPFKIAVLHHPLYVSESSFITGKKYGGNGTSRTIYKDGIAGIGRLKDWPFSNMGIHLILSGHVHLYERIERDSVIYITNGIGGDVLYDFHGESTPHSKSRYCSTYGALLAEVQEASIKFILRDINSKDIDTFVLKSYNIH